MYVSQSPAMPAMPAPVSYEPLCAQIQRLRACSIKLHTVERLLVQSHAAAGTVQHRDEIEVHNAAVRVDTSLDALLAILSARKVVS